MKVITIERDERSSRLRIEPPVSMNDLQHCQSLSIQQSGSEGAEWINPDIAFGDQQTVIAFQGLSLNHETLVRYATALMHPLHAQVIIDRTEP